MIFSRLIICFSVKFKIAINTPAATAVPITPGNVRSHCVHKREVGWIASAPTFCDATRCHRHSRYTCRTDQWVYTFALCNERINLPNNAPAAGTVNAIKPRATIFKVVTFKNASALRCSPRCSQGSTRRITIHQCVACSLCQLLWQHGLPVCVTE